MNQSWAREEAQKLVVKLRLGIMATPGVISVKDEWRYKETSDAILSAYSRGRKDMKEEAAKVARECYHGPKDHGCNHGKEISEAIRELDKEK